MLSIRQWSQQLSLVSVSMVFLKTLLNNNKKKKVLLIFLCHPHLHFHHVDGVPAPFDLLRSIASLLDENYSSEPIVQVPQVHRRHATFKVALKKQNTSMLTHRQGGY